MRLSRATVALVLLGAGATPAGAAPEEIQVYVDEMNRPGQFGLDVHNSYVLTGQLAEAYPGEQPSLHRYRCTPEFSYGLTRFLELGLYVPLATIDRDARVGADGVKARLKLVAPRAAAQPWFWGGDFEIGAVDHALDANPYNAELKGIGGVRAGGWLAALNVDLDFKVSGPASSPPSLALDTKVSYELAHEVAVGVETYNGAGELRSLGHFGRSEQSTFVTVDARRGTWELNVGIGSGYGANPDRLILKVIVGIPID